MKTLGIIIGQADPTGFEFNITDADNRPQKYEYIQIDHNEGGQNYKVLGQVKRLYSRHPFYDQRTTPGAAWKQQELGLGEDLMQTVAHVKILG